MIYTRADGTPIEKPEADDYPTAWEFMRAYCAWRDEIANVATTGSAVTALNAVLVVVEAGACLDLHPLPGPRRRYCASLDTGGRYVAADGDTPLAALEALASRWAKPSGLVLPALPSISFKAEP